MYVQFEFYKNKNLVQIYSNEVQLQSASLMLMSHSIRGFSKLYKVGNIANKALHREEKNKFSPPKNNDNKNCLQWNQYLSRVQVQFGNLLPNTCLVSTIE